MAAPALTRAPAPLSTPISDLDQKTGKMTGYVPTPWSDYFNGLDAQLGQSYAILDHVQVSNGSAAIGVTPITNQILAAGLYRVAFYLTTLQKDNTASNMQLYFTWTDRGLNRYISPGAVTINDTVAGNQSATYLLRCDRATPIVYQMLYASTGGAPKLIFGLDIVLEQVLKLP